MTKALSLIVSLVICAGARAEELRVSAKDSVFVTAPAQWTAAKDRSPSPSFPVETYRVVPPAGHNAIVLISVLAKDKTDYADPQALKKLLRADCRPYVSSAEELPKIELKELKITAGSAFYANFVDPDLVGKPVKTGTYKTATPIILNLGSKYLIKITLLCDEINGNDYRDAMKVVESIKIKAD